jgi:hypothetical protein
MAEAASPRAKAAMLSLTTDIQPHEWLKSVMLGAGVEQTYVDGETNAVCTEIVYPKIELRMEAAKASAPYFAPKLVSQKIEASVRPYENLTDEELLAKLAEKEEADC